MTVIIKELVVKTAVVEEKQQVLKIDDRNLRNDILNDCLKKMKSRSKRKRER